MKIWAWIEERTAPASHGLSPWYHGSRIVLAIVLALGTYALFPSSPAVDFPLYEVGSVSPTRVVAPFAFDVPKDPDELRREREEVLRVAQPVFTAVPAGADSAVRRLTQFMTAIAARSQITDVAEQTRAIIAAADSFGIRLETPEAAYLANSARRQAIRTAVERAYTRVLAPGVAPAGALDSVTGDVILRRGGVEQTFRSEALIGYLAFVDRAQLMQPDPDSRTGAAVYTKVLRGFFVPTIVLDRAATDARRAELQSQVSQHRYQVRAQEMIVDANEVVQQPQYDKMRALREEIQKRQLGERDLGRILGSVLFNALVVAIFGITLLLFRPQLYASMRLLVLIAAVFMVVVSLAAIVSNMTPLRPELVPVAIAAIVLSILFDPRISMIGTMVLAVLIGGQSDFRATNALFINLIGGVAAAFSVRVMARRNQTYYSMLTIAGAYALGAVAIGLTLDRPLTEIATTAAWGGVNAIASVMIAMQILLPLAEEFTGIDTYPRLLEWSDLNRPLMRQLSVEASGTYAHTMALANLAEAAANAIGANGLLARVGAYYHDIGKLKKPQYFVENQPKGRNPHDMLKPATSASIIRNHVREGLELAAAHRLPKSVRAFITEHHGTGAITYFLEKAKERDGTPSNLNEYAYPGPLPQTAETAIVMLADGVEAAARVLNDPTPQRIRDVIDHIVRNRMEQGQLREAPITLKQLDAIKEQFARVLMAQHHNRIEYPAAAGGVTGEFSST